MSVLIHSNVQHSFNISYLSFELKLKKFGIFFQFFILVGINTLKLAMIKSPVGWRSTVTALLALRKSMTLCTLDVVGAVFSLICSLVANFLQFSCLGEDTSSKVL